VSPTVAGPTVASPAPPAAKAKRRWPRVAIPFGTFVVAWLVIIGVHLAEQPSLGNAGTLSPTGTGYDGSSDLARRLAEQGVQLVRVTSGAEAVQQAGRYTGSTVFVPTPNYLSPAALAAISTLDGPRRIVIVRPDIRAQVWLDAPIYSDSDRWASSSRAPRCSFEVARRAGPAAATRARYGWAGGGSAVPTIDCYDGGLLGVSRGGLETVYIGATDPFRNGRIAENGNAALAVGLLSPARQLIWVDVHRPEPVTLPNVNLPRPGPINLPYDRGDQDRTSTGFPTIDAFPQVLWATLVIVAFVAILAAFAWARRLGPPVAEPLPVLIPAAESVTGRGRLYDKVNARGPTLEILRAAAIARLARIVNPFGTTASDRDLLRPGPAQDGFVALLAQRSGQHPTAIRATLYGPEPDNDEVLAAAVADLDALVDATLRDDTAVVAPEGRTP
jgi:hypothetical protein